MKLCKCHRLFDLGNGLGRVKSLGTYSGAVHDRMTPVQTHRVFQHRLAFLLALVPRIGQPAIGLQQHGRTEVLFGVPPV